MKKIISIILLLSVGMSLVFAASKKEKSNNIVLSPKNKFAIEGKALGSTLVNQGIINEKGEIFWLQNSDEEWRETGWDLRGIDFSAYGGLRIEFATGQQFENIELKLSNPAVMNDWTFKCASDGIAYILFDGRGRSWGDMKDPDPTEGFEIKICGEVRSYKTTKIKSIELIKKEDIPDSSSLKLSGSDFGSLTNNARLLGKEITWPKNTKDSYCGWDLSGVNLSEYDRLRIEIEENNSKDLHVVVCEPDWNNWHGFYFSDPDVFEIDLSGEGAAWCDDESFRFDKSKGCYIFMRVSNEKPYKNEQKTVVKSVQLLKGKSTKNENLKLLGVNFGTGGYSSIVRDGGIIEWECDGKQKNPAAGWNVENLDLSKWDTIRIEIEETDIPVDICLIQKDKEELFMGFNPVKPNILEAKLNGTGAAWYFPEGIKLDPSKNMSEINVRANNVTKKGLKTKVKSITLLTKEETEKSGKQPDQITLNGSRLGSTKDQAWIDDNFAINWEVVRNKYSNCGWKVEKLDGEILEIKIASTDYPLRLRINEIASGNSSSWLDDGTHIFRINLKTKKQESNGKWNASEWNKNSKPFDFSKGCEIVLEPANGVFKEGKKTVVESIKVE